MRVAWHNMIVMMHVNHASTQTMKQELVILRRELWTLVYVNHAYTQVIKWELELVIYKGENEKWTLHCDIKRSPACPALAGTQADEGMDQAEMAWKDLRKHLGSTYLLYAFPLYDNCIALFSFTILIYKNYNRHLQKAATLLHSHVWKELENVHLVLTLTFAL